MMPGLADHLAAPPTAYAHLPYDAESTSPKETLLALRPASVRLLACKRSWDGDALIVRLQEAVGKKTKSELVVASREAYVPLLFSPFEIKTVRIEKDGAFREVALVEETPT
jgi:alpha-mannosidase